MVGYFKKFSNEISKVKEDEKARRDKQQERDIKIDEIYKKYTPLIALDILQSEQCLKGLCLYRTYSNDSKFLIEVGFQTHNMLSFLDEMSNLGINWGCHRFEELIERIATNINDNYFDIRAISEYGRLEISCI